ncbi:hypothetical protein GCM10015535_32800 [Streptomyces gelaticus]|uniref:Uncharacterized protein n=1 Tax=Streptomyces gelaticus TaxID=285446 RepID=A0ABQ2VZU1_9ACTN|nr:hypothetical protein GCM10015535_32800 [Streptomyces gelaticus]
MQRGGGVPGARDRAARRVRRRPRPSSTYAAAGAGLEAAPLEVFAALGEVEVKEGSDLADCLRERRRDGDGPAAVISCTTNPRAGPDRPAPEAATPPRTC